MLQKSVSAAMLAQLTQREQASRRRSLQVVQPLSSREIAVDGCRYVNYSSNDYLGLSQHPEVLRAYANAMTTGARASSLVTGYSSSHADLCDLLADVLERPRVLLFSSAFAANVGVLTSIGRLYRQLFLDRLAHASLLQGAKQSGQRWRRFQHNAVATLDDWLAKSPSPSLCISESIFSMDGDAAPTEQLRQLAASQLSCDLMLDDAHGFGVCGDRGRSSAAQFKSDQVALITLAFGKACGVAGGAVACDTITADYLVNYCPELIYSTAMPPAQAAAIKASVAIIVGNEGEQLRRQLNANIGYFHSLCKGVGLPISASTHAIQTVQVGDDRAALAFSEKLRELGVWCSAIRPPTVPEGTARLRITLTAAHNEYDIKRLVHGLERCFQEQEG